MSEILFLERIKDAIKAEQKLHSHNKVPDFVCVSRKMKGKILNEIGKVSGVVYRKNFSTVLGVTLYYSNTMIDGEVIVGYKWV